MLVHYIGAISVSKIMMMSHSLQELYIGENHIDDNGISAIAEQLINVSLKYYIFRSVASLLPGLGH